jgi:hypothetical protein
MAHLAIDGVKRRLTERTDLAVAVKFLMAHGFADDQIGVQLSRHYYVDIDELNDVVACLSQRPTAAIAADAARSSLALRA